MLDIEKLKNEFELEDKQIEYYKDVLRALEFDEETVELIIELSKKEITMNSLMTILASFGMYESADEIDQDYFDLIVSSITVIVESIKEMQTYIDHQNMVN